MEGLQRYAEAPASRQPMMTLPNWRELRVASSHCPLRGQIIPLHTTAQFVTMRRPRLRVFSARAVCQ